MATYSLDSPRLALKEKVELLAFNFERIKLGSVTSHT